MTNKCQRCNHTWKLRKIEKPKTCPNCKSPYWEVPAKRVSKDFLIVNNDLIKELHDLIILKSGGQLGVRDEGGIYHSIFKIWNYSLKKFDYPVKIGAFIFDELAKRHHFFDGNKRTAYGFAKSIMITMGCHFVIKYPDAEKFIIEIAKYKSQKTFEEIEEWIRGNMVMISEKIEINTYLKNLIYDIQYGEKRRERENDRKGKKNN